MSNASIAEIPIIQSFSSVIEATVRKCFELSEMESTFHALANLKENTERKIQSSCWLNQFSHLNELIETNEIQTNDHLLTTVKAITECLRPLKVYKFVRFVQRKPFSR